MGTLIRYLSLFFVIILAEVLHISVFRYGHVVIALLLFFVFFLRPQTALICAFFAGLFEDSITGPFGFHMIVYSFISLFSTFVCGMLLTNKSFLAFSLLEISGFFAYHIVWAFFYFLSGFFYRQGVLAPFQYAEEMLLGFFMQSVFIGILFLLQYRRIRFSRAYLMFSE